MDGHPHGGAEGKPESELRGSLEQAALNERVARLEAELTALRGEVAGLRLTPPEPASAEAFRSVQEAEPVLFDATAASQADAAPTAVGESLESRLATGVLSKVGVVLLLAGVAWFLKWAFDNRWVGPAGRVIAGLVTGAGVHLWSERFRRQQMEAFRYALNAVGSGVLYLSLWASFQLYHLVPAPVALAAMIAVTAWNAWLAWTYDAQLLAGYALLGAYLTPLLLHTGGNHEVFLFSYLLAIALSLLALLRERPWSPLLLGALPATAAFFIAWYSEFFDPQQAFRTAVFALLLWAAFAAVPFVTMETESVIANVLEPLGAGVFGALTVYSVLADSGGRRWEFWCGLGFAAVYAGASAAIAKLRRSNSMAAMVHLGLAVSFVTAAIALKLSGREITVGWLVEAILLLLAGFWRRAAMVRWLGLALLAVAILKLFAIDLRNLGTGYRVLSYLGLGALLMAVSFAYQKDWLGLGGTAAGEAEAEPKRREAGA
jgi:uncharacterized membrane protein